MTEYLRRIELAAEHDKETLKFLMDRLYGEGPKELYGVLTRTQDMSTHALMDELRWTYGNCRRVSEDDD